MSRFSVLMSIYDGDDPAFLKRAMHSIYDEQTIKPNEIILIKDGPINSSLEAVINSWQKKLNGVLKVISLDKNSGLGASLKTALPLCSYELIARMDSDDISLPNRFEAQLNAFENDPDLDICGTQITEFCGDENKITASRVLPLNSGEIAQYAKLRSPFNHVSVMYKKSSILAADNYQSVPYFEDYDLFCRLIKNGAKSKNLAESLVLVRAGANQIKRRRGLKYIKCELDFLIRQLKIGFFSPLDFVVACAIRLPLRLLPSPLLGFIYKIFLRR